MKNLFIASLLVLITPTIASAQSNRLLGEVASISLSAKFDIPLKKDGWTVIESADIRVSTASEFTDTSSVVCGIMIPNGAASSDNVPTHWDLHSRSVVATDRFVSFKTIASNGMELNILCGKGFSQDQRVFLEQPTYQEFLDLLNNYFTIRANFL